MKTSLLPSKDNVTRLKPKDGMWEENVLLEALQHLQYGRVQKNTRLWQQLRALDVFQPMSGILSLPRSSWLAKPGARHVRPDQLIATDRAIPISEQECALQAVAQVACCKAMQRRPLDLAGLHGICR